MSHLDPEQLALIALGEPVASAEEREHLATCAVCTADVEEMMHAAVVARSTVDEGELEAPPARVWGRIADELGLAGAVATASPAVATTPASQAAETTTPAPPAAEAPPVPEETVTDAVPPAAASTPSARARQRRRGWSQRAWWALAASVAFVLVIGGGVWIGVGSLTPTSIASASLEAFPDHPKAVGTAEVDESRDGAHDGPWLKSFVAEGGMQYVDGLSIHTYDLGDGPQVLRMIAWVSTMHQELQKDKRYVDLPWYLTEVGWPTGPWGTGRWPDWPRHPISEQDQANNAVQFILLARTLPFVRGVWWYDLVDDGPGLRLFTLWISMRLTDCSPKQNCREAHRPRSRRSARPTR